MLLKQILKEHFYFVLFSTLIYKVSDNDRTQSDKYISKFVAIFSNGCHQLVFRYYRLKSVADSSKDCIPDTSSQSSVKQECR